MPKIRIQNLDATKNISITKKRSKNLDAKKKTSRYQLKESPYKTSVNEGTAAEETHASKPETMRKKQTPRRSISGTQIRRRLRRRGRRRRRRRRRRRSRRRRRRRGGI